ncbi:MAG: 1-deoxy-D-xylulose-5-phosphate reductoisomerase [Clostridiales Family XIII bacterium]|jgi:1-deoxy-D-xylulose-5-phosphate reductoisomerase|nr:1-deoxy-D-xylulose-5-phosphate reductoisomerase [Clostridiales Family XIII bacterium]
MKRVAVFGSTGSVGTQAVSIIEKHPDRLRASVLTCGGNLTRFREQLAALKPETAVVGASAGRGAEEAAAALSEAFPDTRFLSGPAGLAAAAQEAEYDVLLNALTGIAGLIPTWNAVRSGRDVALANKESLVTGGAHIMEEARRRGVDILPVDSEHSAIFQALQGNGGNRLKRIILTTSGGPFRGFTKEELRHVTLRQALAHPSWSMGSKITIDSATMMNKGLEIIEAGWLFDAASEQIEVAVHPQCIIHSMVEFADHSILAQLGAPDMRAPISYALSCPERWETDVAQLDFFALRELCFEEADTDVFSCLRLARRAMREGKSYPVALNAANETLVKLFLEQKIGFTDIQENIERVLDAHSPADLRSPDEILEADRAVREKMMENMKIK